MPSKTFSKLHTQQVVDPPSRLQKAGRAFLAGCRGFVTGFLRGPKNSFLSASRSMSVGGNDIGNGMLWCGMGCAISGAIAGAGAGAMAGGIGAAPGAIIGFFVGGCIGVGLGAVVAIITPFVGIALAAITGLIAGPFYYAYKDSKNQRTIDAVNEKILTNTPLTAEEKIQINAISRDRNIPDSQKAAVASITQHITQNIELTTPATPHSQHAGHQAPTPQRSSSASASHGHKPKKTDGKKPAKQDLREFYLPMEEVSDTTPLIPNNSKSAVRFSNGKIPLPAPADRNPQVKQKNGNGRHPTRKGGSF